MVRKLRTENRKLKRRLCNQERKFRIKEAKLKQQIEDLANKLEHVRKFEEVTAQDIIANASRYLKGTCLHFFSCQITQAKRRARGRRFTRNDKIFAISLYYQSAKAYRFLQKPFILPCKSTINKWLEGIDFEPGFNDDILNVLQHRVENMKAEHRVCALLIDEVALKGGLNYNSKTDQLDGLEDFGGILGRTKHFANQGLVFMVRGLCQNWKQPLCYFLAKDGTRAPILKDLVVECIEKLSAIGLQVKVVIGDQGTHNQGMFKLFDITTDSPFISLNNQQIYFMYDPPHLFKSVRNNFAAHDIKIGQKTMKWKYIKEFYEKEKARGNTGCKGGYKLTDEHIYLPPFSKMSVKRAAQVLSHTVAAGINTHVGLGELPAEASFTSEFCEHMDRLLNSFNGKSLYAPIDKPLRNACSDSTNHMTFWQDTKDWMASWEIQSKHIKCVQGWILTLSSTMLLWADLRDNFNFQFLHTARLNQDCLENLFSVVRQKGGSNDNPQCHQFRYALKAATIDKLMKPRGKNCKDDDDNLLIDLLDISKLRTRERKNAHPSTNTHTNDNTTDMPSSSNTTAFPSRSMPEQNVLVFVTGWLCFKILTKHKCSQCMSYMVNPNPQLDDPRFLFTHFKSAEVKDSEFGFLKIPTTQFINFIDRCESLFVRDFNNLYYVRDLNSRILRHIINDTQRHTAHSNLCASTMSALLKLFIRTRVHYCVKFFNKKLKSTKRKNRKYLKVSHL